MRITLGSLVEQFGGTLIGDAEAGVVRIAPLEEAGKDDITFLSNPKLRAQAKSTTASALILTESDNQVIGDSYSGARIITKNPYVYFARVAQLFDKAKRIPKPHEIHPTAYVDKTAVIDPTAYIGPHVTIEADAHIAAEAVIEAGCFVGMGAKIGARSHLHPNVVFMEYCELGEDCEIRPGAVIGCEGFGFANENGQWIKIPQIGRVIIGNNVQIGANTTIDRGALSDTIIEEGVKLDNQIQIGHNCQVGAHTAMAGCVGIGGSSKIGKYCMLGGGVGVAGHLEIADKVVLSAFTGVMGSLPKSGHYAAAYPIATHREWQRTAAIVRNLDDMRNRVRELEQMVKTLTDEKK